MSDTPLSVRLPDVPPPHTVRLMPVAAFLEIWPSAPKLSPEEAAAYAADLRADRASLGPVDDPWA